MPDTDLRVHPTASPRLSTLLGVPIREDTLTTNQRGEEKPGIRKRSQEMLEKLQEVLRKALGPEEVVLYVARCQAPVSPFEQLTFGWYIYYVTATVLVFTNRRLLHFDVTRKGTWKRMLRTVSWGDIDQAKVTGWLSKYLELKYRTGKKERYWRLSREDGNKIKVLLDAIFAAGGRESTAAETVTSLCPDCLAELALRVYNCPRCGLVFKDEKTMVRRSLLIPGGGYFYTGHWFLAVGDFLVEAYLLVLVIVFALFAVGALVDTSTEPGAAPLAGGTAWIAAGFVAAILAVEKLLTIHHCKRFVRAFVPSK